MTAPSLLPRHELLAGCPRAADLAPLIDAAAKALRTWEPVWTPLLDAALQELTLQRLGSLSELSLATEGGHPGAERRRLVLQRAEAALEPASLEPGLLGLEISGNFLFDPASAAEFRQGLQQVGATAGDLGDLWLRNERGAQTIVDEALAWRLDGQPGQVRSVAVTFASRPIAELRLPEPRLPRRITSGEASLRLDALASAGFGLPRSRMAELIRQGAVRIDWCPVSSPSRDLAVGERVQLEGKGELKLESAEATKRGRYRVVMTRH